MSEKRIKVEIWNVNFKLPCSNVWLWQYYIRKVLTVTAETQLFFPLMLFCHQKRVNLVGQPLLVAPDQQAARTSAFIELFTVADD